MLVQWLFNGCSMVGERLSPCVLSSVFCFEHECGRGCCLCFVSHEFFLVVENRVYLGGCFSWKAWQKIRMPCAENQARIRQQRSRLAFMTHRHPDALCGGASRRVFGCLQRRFFHNEDTDRTFFVLKKGKQSDILQGKTERKDRKKRFVNKK